MPKKKYESFNRIHASVANYLKDYGLESALNFGHIPLYLRINTGIYKNKDLYSRPYATTKWHLDAWAGESADVVVFLYHYLAILMIWELNLEKWILKENLLCMLRDYSDGAAYIRGSTYCL